MGMQNVPMSPLLAQTQAAIAKAVKPQSKEAYDKILLAGMKLAFDKKTHGSLIEGLNTSKDPIRDIAVGTVGLLLLMAKQAKGTMPQDAMVTAGMAMVVQGLDYYEKVSGTEITKQDLDRATEIFTSTLLPKIGITPEVMNKAVGHAQNAMSNKELMAQFKQQAGA